MINTKNSLYAATILLAVLFNLVLPQTSPAGTAMLGCCIDADGCVGCGPHEDCSIRGVDCPLPPDATFFAGELCLGLGASDDECKTPDGGESGCCVIKQGDCSDGQSLEECNGANGDAWFDKECSEVSQCMPISRNVPTLSKWALISLAGIIGIVGFMVIRRKQATA